MRPVPRLLLALAVSFCIGGCGAGGGDDDAGPVTVTITSSGAIDGFVTNTGDFNSAGAGPVVGDTDCYVNGSALRMFFHFDISGIPASATILSATFQPYVVNHVGNPLILGNQVADHVDFGAVLDAGDYATVAGLLAGNIGTAADTLVIGYRSVDATASVIADRAAARLYSEFRIRTTMLDSNSDMACDYINWEDGENSYLSGHPPILSVTYVP